MTAPILPVTSIHDPIQDMGEREEYEDFVDPAKNTSRQRNWFFTLNNPTDLDKQQLHELPVQWLIYSLEKGKKNGTPHFQGCMCLKVQMRLAALSRLLPRAAIFRTRLIPNAIAYVSKQDTHIDGPWTVGKVPHPTQGERTDIQACLELAKTAAGTEKDFAEQHTSLYIRHRNNVLALRRLYMPKRDFHPRIIIMYGPTGTGKSMRATTKFGEYYSVDHPFTNEKNPGLMWFDDYDPIDHPTIVFNDYKGCWCAFTYFLNLIDCYPMKVQTKGGSQHLLAKTMVFTSRAHPNNWYPNKYAEGEYDQIWRRLEAGKGALFYVDSDGLNLERGVWPDELRTNSDESGQDLSEHERNNPGPFDLDGSESSE